MEQDGLKNQDLIPYLGSASRVSQVLNGHRDLTLKQARALHHGLGIPAEVMLQEFSHDLVAQDPTFVWENIPVMEMISRGWIDFSGSAKAAKERAEELARPFIMEHGMQSFFCRRGQGGEKDPYAMLAFCAGVNAKVSKQKLTRSFDSSAVTDEVVQGLVKLSALPSGPQLVEDYLGNYGIHFVTVKHFDKTHLDGAAMLLRDGSPVVVLTLRHDRLDNFWFTLLHELAHVMNHLNKDNAEPFFDDLDAVVDDCEQEEDANRFAMESLLPDYVFEANQKPWSAQKIQEVAFERGISPAIIAGRIQRNTGNYRKFHQLVGRGEVRKHFPDYDQ